MQLTSRNYEADSIEAVQELYHSSGWTDGLPIVPPTRARVDAFLAFTPRKQMLTALRRRRAQVSVSRAWRAPFPSAPA